MRTATSLKATSILVILALVLLAFSGMPLFAKAPASLVLPGPSPFKAMSTRTNVSEAEPNNAESSATILSRTDSPMNLTGNISVNDQDYFKITLSGGSGPVDNLSFTPRSINLNGNTALTIWIYGSYPSSSDSYLLLSQYYWGNTHNPCWIHASFTGTYLIWMQKVYAATAATAYYNIWVNVTSVTPRNSYNDIGSAQEINKTRTGENVSLNENCYDWYKFKLPDSNWPSRINFTVNITNSPTNVYWGGSYKVLVIIPVFFMYRLKSSPGTYTTEKYQLSRDTAETSLQPTKTINFEKNITEAVIGFTVDTYGYNSGTPTMRYILDAPESQGWANYTINMTGLTAMVPNKAPILSSGNVTPLSGRTTVPYTYSVKYQDPEGWAPRGIHVTVDTTSYPLTKRAGEGSDYVSGVVYETTLPGTTVGLGSHTYSFFCTDQKDPAIGDTGLHNGPYLDDNYAPRVKASPPSKVIMSEDSPQRYLSMATIFEDPDMQPLDYSLLNQGTWSKILSHNLAQLTILANGTLKITPNANKNGAFNVSLNATDGKAWCPSPFVLQIEMTPMNDRPVISKIGGKSVSGGLVNLVTNEDLWTNIVIDASDTADGDNVTITTDIGSVLSGAQEGVNWMFDQKNRTLSMLPSDADVGPGLTMNISCSDGNGGDVWAQAVIDVKNTNDKPVLAPIENLTVKQYFWKNITLFATDDDSDSGDTRLFFTDIEQAIPGISPGIDYLWSPDTGNMSLNPSPQGLIGQYQVTFGVQDREGTNSTLTVTVTIENTNDPPMMKAISFKGGVKNLTVIASTEAASDLDGDETSYTWDFGDGSQAISGGNLLSLAHNYSAAGRYNITLTASDGEATVSKKLEVQVTAPLPPVIVDDDVDDDIKPNITDDDDTLPNVTVNDTAQEEGLPCFVWVMVIVIIVLMIGLFAILIFAKKKDKKAKKARAKAKTAQPKEEAPDMPEPAVEESALLEPTPAYQPGPAVQEYQGLGDGRPPAAIEVPGQVPSLEPGPDDMLALPPARNQPIGASKEVVLDEIFGGMEQTTAPTAAPELDPMTRGPAQQPAKDATASPAGAPASGKGVPSAAEIDDIFASIDEPAKK